MKYSAIIALLLVLSLSSCKTKTNKDASISSSITECGVDKSRFSKVIDGKEVALFTLKNKDQIQVQITNYGGRIVSIITPDRNGKFADIAMGYSTIDQYLADGMYQSGIIGRYANRIAKGTFDLDDVTYTLATNDGPNSLHGGLDGFNKKVWEATQIDNKLTLTYVSPDMEEGFPGELTVKVTYELNDKDELSMVYEATTNKTTLVNLTNHTYYNLKGDGDSSILDHSLQIMANSITPVDATLIPTGQFDNVENTPFDFREEKRIGKDIGVENKQLILGGGFDHNWVLDKKPGELALAAKLSESTTGRVMELYTTKPGMQFYSGNFMDGTFTGKAGKKYTYRSALAFEPQYFPDSPNQSHFPSAILQANEKYYQKCVLKFYTK